MNDEPGWRSAWVARLNWLFSVDQPPTSARTRPRHRVERHQRALDLRHLAERHVLVRGAAVEQLDLEHVARLGHVRHLGAAPLARVRAQDASDQSMTETCDAAGGPSASPGSSSQPIRADDAVSLSTKPSVQAGSMPGGPLHVGERACPVEPRRGVPVRRRGPRVTPGAAARPRPAGRATSRCRTGPRHSPCARS